MQYLCKPRTLRLQQPCSAVQCSEEEEAFASIMHMKAKERTLRRIGTVALSHYFAICIIKSAPPCPLVLHVPLHALGTSTHTHRFIHLL